MLCVLSLCTALSAAAQSPAEIATWLQNIGGEVNSQKATPELVAKAYSVDFGRAKGLVTADLAKLKGISGLREVTLDKESATDANVAELAKQVPGLKTLKLWGNVTDAAMADVAKFTALEELSLQGSKVTDAGMANVAKCPKLARLTLSKTAVTENGLESLKGAGLTNLVFDGLAGTKKAMAAIASMPKLKVLQLQFATTNDEVGELAKAPALQEITLMASPNFDDVGGAHLGKIKTLERLFIWNTKVTDKTMEAISGLPLKTLYVSRTALTDKGMASLAKIKTLETLWIEKTEVGDKGVAAFAKHPKLRWLKADETKITDGCVTTLVTLAEFDSLQAPKAGITEAGEKKLKEKFPKARVYR
ncbi:MAG: hypothetical protein QM817_00335 [Archangium sp.]